MYSAILYVTMAQASMIPTQDTVRRNVVFTYTAPAISIAQAPKVKTTITKTVVVRQHYYQPAPLTTAPTILYASPNGQVVQRVPVFIGFIRRLLNRAAMKQLGLIP